jgi:diguanylate cyclase (GGDEF)-like protein
MSPWLVPVSIELCLLVVFGAVLYHLRKSLNAKSFLLWLTLWLGRAAASLAGIHFLPPTTGNFLLAVYTPLQTGFALGLVLIVYRLEHQKRELRQLQAELRHLRTAAAGPPDSDPLTGLLSRSALARWLDEESPFEGIVAVCDLDNFKALNDLYGHLVGDEILHGFGQLLLASVRQEDRAFRWGGDEFVIVLRSLSPEVAQARLQGIEERLQKFQIRNHGPISVSLSWGMAPAAGRPLRETLAEADRNMYAAKRRRHKQQSAGNP